MSFQAELAAYVAARPETFKTAAYRQRAEQALAETSAALVRATRFSAEFQDKALVASYRAQIVRLETELANW